MPIIIAIVCLAIGGASIGVGGAFLGAVVGYVAGELLLLRQTVKRLQGSLDDLRRDTARQQAQLELQTTPKTVVTGPTPDEFKDREPSSPARVVSRSTAAPTVAAANRVQPTPRARVPAPPSAVERFFAAAIKVVRDYFTGGNTIVRVSIIVLLFGVAFLLQYAAEHSHVPIEVRLIGVVVVALALLVLGWRLRIKRAGYGLALQGGAVGILYLVIFAALRIYALLPATLAFTMLLAIVLLSAILAVLQDSMWFAILGVSGGFLAPILTSTGQGSHVVLFSFYAVLNLGILAMAWFKAWRPLNVIGFAFTFVIGIAWGVTRYTPELFASTEPFLIAFFLFYVAIAVLFAARQEPNLRGYVDGTIVFGTPIIAFGIQSALLHEQRYLLALSALIVSGLYLSLATLLWKRRANWRLLVESFLALSVVFLTLALPLALNGRWSAVSWAIEGAALVWVGCRQSRLLPRMAGVALQIASATMFARDIDELRQGTVLFNSTCLGALIIAIAGLMSSKVFQKYEERLRRAELANSALLFWWALLWWLIAGLNEIDRFLPSRLELHAAVVFLAASAIACSEVRRRLLIRVAQWPTLWLLPIMYVGVTLDWIATSHPSADFGWIAWVLVFGAFYQLCRRHEKMVPATAQSWLHAFGAWLLLVLLSRECAWQIDQLVAGAGSWPVIAWALIPATALLVLPLAIRSIKWPVAAHIIGYRDYAGAGVILFLLAWSFVSIAFQNGDPYPLPYAPILNPLDLAQIFVLIAGLAWSIRLIREQSVAAPFSVSQTWGVFGVVVFCWLNAVLLRTIHYWNNIPYSMDVMWHTTLVQASLSIFWTVLALATMFFATRRKQRVVWFAGAALMGVVLLKLVFVDLSRVGSVARIVSFIGVGLLMLVIGYFSPMPPKREANV